MRNPGGDTAEGEAEGSEMNGPARANRSSRGPWLARSARASRSVFFVGLSLSMVACGGGQSVGGGPSSAPTLVATNAVSSSAIARPVPVAAARFGGRAALAVAPTYADCQTRARALIPWTGSTPSPMFQAASDAQLPYTTGDPAPNDMTVFAAQVDAACVVLLAVAPVPTGTPMSTPTAVATPTFAATFTPTWTPTAAPIPTATSTPLPDRKSVV